MPDAIIRLACSGCGASPAAGDPYPFQCPNASAGDDIDHVVRRELTAAGVQPGAWRTIFLGETPNPFIRYRALFHSHRVALSRGLSDAAFVELIESLDAAVASVGETGFRETPFERIDSLNGALGRPGGTLWIKDETGNVSGSHKARHMMGLLLWLEVARTTGLIQSDAPSPRLAIASCGNAGLAAAVVARAANRELDVFIPPDAHPNVTRRLSDLGARLTICERRGTEPGDPCVLRFRESLKRGSLPFSVQGNENGLAIEGGLTLGYEIVSALLRRQASIDRISVQVGGGALASSIAQSLRDARTLGLIDKLPAIHAVQTEGAYPLYRAWDRITRMILSGEEPAPGDAVAPYPLNDSARDAMSATSIAPPSMQVARHEAIRFAARHRSLFMWPWEDVPHSIAHGILDDETYDWLAIVEAMLESGGWPVVVSEDLLREANAVASATTRIPADHTGTSGLAGCLRLAREGMLSDSESIAALFTGRTR